MNKKIKWIDCAKCLAILAVLIDHTNGILYTNPDIAMASYFSVSLFILISGMMSYSSNERHELNWVQTFIRSSKNIFLTYLVANIVYLVCINKSFDLSTYLYHIIMFNLSGPFYYVLLYLQLMIINRPLYSIIVRIPQKSNWLYEVFIGIIILCISSLTTNYTNILNVYGGGGRLLGGTYLFLFYVGMLITRHKLLSNITTKKSIAFSLIGFTLWLVWWRFECANRFALDAKLPFGAGFNPPSISSFVMAIIVLILSCGVFSLLELTKCTRWIVSITSWVGSHTLYIFLYHRLFLDYIIGEYYLIDNLWIRRLIYFTTMIIGSIALDYLFDFVKKLIARKGKIPYLSNLKDRKTEQ